MYLIERTNITAALAPNNYTGAAGAGDWASFQNYHKCLIVIQTGAWAGGTAAVTLDQATTAAGGSTKTLGFSRYYSKLNTAAAYTETAATSDTFDLSAANTIYAIDVKDDDLDVDNAFDFFQLDVASPGANDDFYSAIYIMYEPAYSSSTQVTAIA